MELLIGTDLGLYRVDEVPFDADDAELVLDCGPVTSVRRFEYRPEVFVTSAMGAYRSDDGGRTWVNLGLPSGDRFGYSGESDVWSILAVPGGTLYAGTNDPALYRSPDDGETWMELRSFRTLESRGMWESPRDPHYARVRAIEAIPGWPEHLIVGIEAGGIHLSRDGGATWIDRREESPLDDIHQVLPLDPDVYLVATGHLDLNLEHLGLGHAVGEGGIHRTTDGGKSWTRLDDGNEFSYVRRMFIHDGVLFFCGANKAPPEWGSPGHKAALFESTDFGRTFERIDHPGDDEVIEAWTVADGQVICGSGYYRARNMEATTGRIMLREDGEYETIGRTHGNVSALVAL